MKSKELKAYNLPSDDVLINQIDAKPRYLFVILFLLGILSFGLKFPPIYGVMSITLAIILLLYTPKVTLMEFYNDYLVIYNKADKNNCVLIYYDEVSSWYYAWGGRKDYLYIELEDGSTEKIEAFSKTIFESNMNRHLRDKRKKSK